MTINYTPKVGDYVVHAELTLEEYTKFHDAAIAGGFKSYWGDSAETRWSEQWPYSRIDLEGDIVSCSDYYLDIEDRNVTHLFKQQPFTKADLRNGMLVEYRNGDVRMVWAGELFIPEKLDARYHGLNWYTQDLYDVEGSEEIDIMAVYEHAGATPSDFTKGKLIWKREVPQIKPKTKVMLELTDEQLEQIKQVIGGDL